MKSIICFFQGKCNAKAGYFPAKYVISLQKNQKVFQVSHAMHLTDGDVDMKLHKDQVNNGGLWFGFGIYVV